MPSSLRHSCSHDGLVHSKELATQISIEDKELEFRTKPYLIHATHEAPWVVQILHITHFSSWREAILLASFVQIRKIYAHSPFTVWFFHKHYVRQPVRVVCLSYEPCCEQAVNLNGDGNILFSAEAPTLQPYSSGLMNHFIDPSSSLTSNCGLRNPRSHEPCYNSSPFKSPCPQGERTLLWASNTPPWWLHLLFVRANAPRARL